MINHPFFFRLGGGDYRGGGGGGGGGGSGGGYGPKKNSQGYHGDERPNPRTEQELFHKNEAQVAGINFDKVHNIIIKPSLYICNVVEGL